MPKAKTREELDKQIADTKNEIRQSENLLKEQLQKNHKQERNDRTHLNYVPDDETEQMNLEQDA